MNCKVNFKSMVLILYGCLFFWVQLGSAATFTITNYRSDSIDVEVHLSKSIGSKTLRATIPGNGGYHKFNTGISKVPRGGIHFRDNKTLDFYQLSDVAVNNIFMLSGTIRLYRDNQYDFELGSIKGIVRL